MGEAARSRPLFSLRGAGNAQWLPHSLERGKKAPSDSISNSPGKMFPPPSSINAVDVCKSHVKGSTAHEDSSVFDH